MWDIFSQPLMSLMHASDSSHCLGSIIGHWLSFHLPSPVPGPPHMVSTSSHSGLILSIVERNAGDQHEVNLTPTPALILVTSSNFLHSIRTVFISCSSPHILSTSSLASPDLGSGYSGHPGAVLSFRNLCLPQL
jgi:hypothetical protein